jgi:hypothetical protein
MAQMVNLLGRRVVPLGNEGEAGKAWTKSSNVQKVGVARVTREQSICKTSFPKPIIHTNMSLKGIATSLTTSPNRFSTAIFQIVFEHLLDKIYATDTETGIQQKDPNSIAKTRSSVITIRRSRK